MPTAFSTLTRPLSRGEMLAHEALPREQRDALIERLLAAALREAADAPFYSPWADLLHTAQPASARAILARLPVISRADVRAHSSALLREIEAPGGLVRMSTGGTTGEPAVWQRLRSEHTVGLEFVWAAWARVGASPGDRRVTVRGVATGDPAAGTVSVQEEGRRLVVSMNDGLSPQDWDRVVGEIVEHRPLLLEGVGTLLFELAGHVAGRVQVRDELRACVRALAYSSDTLTRTQRHFVEDVFSRPLLSLYGMSEQVVQAASCLCSDDLHLRAEYGYVELLDEYGDLVTDPGVVGEVVATSLISRATAFVRYRTGDLAAWAPDVPCLCGRTERRLTGLQGRTLAVVADRFGRRQFFGPAKYDAFLEALPAGARAQFAVSEGAVEVRVTCADDALDAVSRAAEDVFGALFVVSVERVPRLERTARGKFEIVVRP